MPCLSKEVQQAWEQREGAVILATTDEDGIPNAIYVTCVNMFNDEKLVIADNYFHKTRSNIMAGSKGALLFLTRGGKAYQIKGAIEYHSSGDIFDDMKRWLDPKHPGIAATVVNVEEVYCGAEKLV